MSIKKKIKWTNVEQDNFDKIKRIMARDNLLTFPGFNETCKIHTDVNVFQLGPVISQKDKTISLNSIKLTVSQHW